MTRTTAQVMEWDDEVKNRTLETYSRGWWDGCELAALPYYEAPDYFHGYIHALLSDVSPLRDSPVLQLTQPPKA